MSGMASTTRSPSSFSTSRSVVCVAGCCGPKFKRPQVVARFGVRPDRSSVLAAASGMIGSRSIMVRLSRRRGATRENCAARRGLAADSPCAAGWAVNSSGSRIRRRSGWPAKRMPNMSHTSRSSQLAPSHSGTAEGTVGSGSFDERAHRDPLVRLGVGQQIDQAEAILGAAIVQVIDAGDVDQQIEAALDRARTRSTANSSSARHDGARVAAEFAPAQARERPRSAAVDGLRSRSCAIPAPTGDIAQPRRLIRRERLAADGSRRAAAK